MYVIDTIFDLLKNRNKCSENKQINTMCRCYEVNQITNRVKFKWRKQHSYFYKSSEQILNIGGYLEKNICRYCSSVCVGSHCGKCYLCIYKWLDFVLKIRFCVKNNNDPTAIKCYASFQSTCVTIKKSNPFPFFINRVLRI